MHDEFIQKETEELSKQYGLDPLKIKPILERTLKTDQRLFSPKWIKWDENDDITSTEPYFWPSLREALECLSPREAILIFEKENLDNLRDKIYLTQYFSLVSPLYSLDELEKITERFIEYLKDNESHLIKTGLPLKPFIVSPWIESILGDLYPVKRPNRYHDIKLLNQKISFLTSPIHIEDLDNIAEHIGIEYDYEWNDMIGYMPTVKKEIDFLEGLKSSDIIWLESKRKKLFNLKIEVLRNLLNCLKHHNDKESIDNIWEGSIKIITDNIDADEAKLLLALDRTVYYGFDITSGEQSKIETEKSHGGFTELLRLVGYYEKEIKIGNNDKIRNALGTLVDPFRRYSPKLNVGCNSQSYFNIIKMGEKKKIDMAVNFFQKYMDEEEKFWTDYYGKISDAIKNEFEKEVTLTKKIKPHHAFMFSEFSNSYLDWSKEYMQTTGELPKMKYEEINKPEPKYVFRKRGDTWEIIFEDKKFEFSENVKGFDYIVYLLSRPNKSISVTQFRRKIESMKHNVSNDPNESIPVQQFQARTGGMSGRKYAINNDTINDMHDSEDGEDGLTLRTEDFSEDILDENALDVIKRKREFLEEQLAKYASDPEKSMEIKEEIKMMDKFSQKDTFVDIDKKVKSRPISGPLENDRKAVSKAIHEGFNKIKEYDENLYDHLHNFIDMSDYQPCYRPDIVIKWET